MNNLVVLGDCATDGSNALAWEVTGENDIQLSMSLLYHKRYSEIIKWYMKYRSQGKITGPIDLRFVQREAIQSLDKEEIKIAWPALLDSEKLKVYNYSSHGNAFLGYFQDLKTHIEKHGKPNLVCIADFAEDHIFVRVKAGNETYCGYVIQSWLGTEYNADVMSYSKQIFDKKQKHGKHQYSKNQTWHNRKAYHALYWLKKFLDTNEINYFFVNYRNNSISKLFDKDKTLDLSQSFNQYNDKIKGDISLAKYNYQSIHSEQVKQYINSKV